MPFKIAIIGLGPKGLFALERLLHEIHRSQRNSSMTIYMFEKSGRFGGGTVYNPEQEDYLLMNYPNRNIDVWIQGSLSCHERIPSLTQFLSLTEMGPALANGYSPRGIVGEYLSFCYDMLASPMYRSTKLTSIVAEVTGIIKSNGQFSIAYDEDGKNKLIRGIDQIMLTTGHESWKGHLGYPKHGSHLSKSISFVYPVSQNLNSIRPLSTVAIKGLGLTFIDTVLALTEGRSGTFIKTDTGKLVYDPSGNEPMKIVPFSKSGMPMVPRLGAEGTEPYSPIFFTFDTFKSRTDLGSRTTLHKDVLPLLKEEAAYRYYEVLWKMLRFEPEGNNAENNLFETIEEFHRIHPSIPRFRFGNLFRPVTMEEPELELSPLAYFRYMLEEAEKGSKSSPFMAAALTWGRVSEAFNRIYSFGGLTADSHREFDKAFRSKLNRISYGPPIENARKILALMEHGILDMDFVAAPEVRSTAEGWEIRDSEGTVISADVLVDARIPKNCTLSNWSELLRSMLKEGLIREYINRGKASYKTACPEIDCSGRAIGSNGQVIENLTLYGSLTEGMTYDNDTLSRSRNDFASAWALRCVEESNMKINENR